MNLYIFYIIYLPKELPSKYVVKHIVQFVSLSELCINPHISHNEIKKKSLFLGFFI